MTNLKKRMNALFIGWGSIGLIYMICALFQTKGYVIQETIIEELIPFNTTMIWIYLSFFLFIPLCFFFVQLKKLEVMKFAYVFSAVVSGIVYFNYPTTLIYPAVEGSSFHDHVWLWLAGFDSPQNCLPSLHAALTLIGMFAIYQKENMLRSIGFTLWGLLIIVSIISTRRHLFIDMSSGLALGTISIIASQKFIAWKRKHNKEKLIDY